MADISQIKLPDNTTYDIKAKSSVAGNVYVGTCSTAAATAAKAVTISADQNFKLKTGSMIIVKFSESNSASNVTLDVNGTGAKSIYYNNAVYTAASTSITGYANAYLVYIYDGTNWVWQGHGADSNTTYSAMSVSEGQTATATSGRSMRADYLKQIIQYHAVPSGQGVPSGGTAGQVLAKVDGTNYNTEWITPSGGGGDVEKYTIANFDSTAIPATDPFCWFIEGANVNNASSSYTAYMPIVKERTSRSGYTMKSAYLFRKESGGAIYALYVGTDHYTLFMRPANATVWACVTPVPGPSFLFSMSGATPTLTMITFSNTSSVGRPALFYDPESFISDNSGKVYRTKMFATIVCDASSADAAKSIQVPIMLCPNGDFFIFHFMSGTTVYRVVCKRTAADTWSATATAL